MASSVLPSSSSSPPPPRALTFYVFDRAGTCLHYADFGRTRSIAEGAGTPGDEAKNDFWTAFLAADAHRGPGPDSVSFYFRFRFAEDELDVLLSPVGADERGKREKARKDAMI